VFWASDAARSNSVALPKATVHRADVIDCGDSSRWTPFKLPDDGWAVFTLYVAARICGAFSGGIMLWAHGSDREAQFMNRALYEYFSKMLHHSTFTEGKKVLASFPKQLERLIKKLRYGPSRFMNDEQMGLVQLSESTKRPSY
jgi:hypothetical protein